MGHHRSVLHAFRGLGAAMKFGSDPTDPTGPPLPISSIGQTTGDATYKTVWQGYVANLKDICKTDPEFRETPNSVFILQTPATITAANVNFRSAPCDRIANVRSGETIFATTDQPFDQGKINWEKRFILVDPNNKSIAPNPLK